MSARGLFKPSKRGKSIKSGARRNILNVFTQLRQENPHDSTNQVVEKVAKFTGVSKRTIYRLRKEGEVSGTFSTPGKKRPNAVGKRTRLERYDCFILSCIRRKVHGFFQRNELPTLDKVLKELSDDKDLFEKNVSRSTLHRILQDLGFSFVKQKKNAVLLERPDIILCRRNYLRNIKEYKKKNMTIYYLDETWVNEGQDTTLKSSETSSNSTAASAEPKSKGRRLIFTHIGSSEGFVPDALDLLIGKTNTEEMDGKHFEKWFETVLPKLKKESVIVMDNAPCHSVKVEEVPTSTWKKSAIQEWLSKKNVNWTSDMIKVELLQKVSEIESLFDKYRVEALAEKHGHVVLRVPPHHGELNPIEMIWSQVKEDVARRNKALKINDLIGLVVRSIKNVPVENWIDCINHVTIEEDEMWEIDGIIDDICDNKNFITSINQCSSDSESESMSADEILPEDCFEKETTDDTWLKKDAGPTLFHFPVCLKKEQRKKKNKSPPLPAPEPPKRKSAAGDKSKDGKEAPTKSRKVSKTTKKQSLENSPEAILRPETFLNLLMATMTSSEAVVGLNPTTLITPDVNPPDSSAPGPSSRMELGTSIMEPLITIKEEPIDPDSYK